jgi:FkbM family methyltransferase
MFKDMIKRALRGAGYTASRYDPRRDSDAVRQRLLESASINTVLDVGANSGQYGERLRHCGYQGKIVSFEPLSSAFAQLQKRAAGDTLWHTERCALGDREEISSINISGACASSSLLDMLPRHTEIAPHTGYVGREQVDVHRLDSLFDRHFVQGDRVFLKIDTQGFTSRVLAGAERSLDRVQGLEVELSVVALYAGEPLIHEILSLLYRKGFAVYSLEPEMFDDTSWQQVQINGLFQRIR